MFILSRRSTASLLVKPVWATYTCCKKQDRIAGFLKLMHSLRVIVHTYLNLSNKVHATRKINIPEGMISNSLVSMLQSN